MENLNRCNLIKDFISNSEIEEMPASLLSHTEECEDCLREWRKYEQLLYDCRKFPKVPMPGHLNKLLNEIPKYLNEEGNRTSVSLTAKYKGLIAVASLLLISLIIYFVFSNIDISFIANNVVKKLDRYSRKAYSKIIKIYDTKNALVGDIKYLGLPITMKIQEVVPKIVNEDINKGEKPKEKQK